MLEIVIILGKETLLEEGAKEGQPVLGPVVDWVEMVVTMTLITEQDYTVQITILMTRGQVLAQVFNLQN